MTVVLGAVLETDLTVVLVQPQSGAERRRVLAVDFEYVSRQRKRIYDDDKMLLSLIAVSVDDACLPPLYFKIVQLSVCLSVFLSFVRAVKSTVNTKWPPVWPVTVI